MAMDPEKEGEEEEEEEVEDDVWTLSVLVQGHCAARGEPEVVSFRALVTGQDIVVAARHHVVHAQSRQRLMPAHTPLLVTRRGN